MKSSRFYVLVTNHWPRIAAGLVIGLGIMELVVGGLTADSSLEFYLLAWAGATGGLWFLFDRAEQALLPEPRDAFSARLQALDLGPTLAAVPVHFGQMFDRVFGKRHVSVRCFGASALSSVVAVTVIYLLTVGLHGWSPTSVITVGIYVVGLNIIPDYLSLLETRFMIGRMAERGRVLAHLVADLLLTALIAIGGTIVFSAVFHQVLEVMFDADMGPALPDLTRMIPDLLTLEPEVWTSPSSMFELPLGVFFYSTFLTSVWLWLYAASVLLSRVLLKMNDGVGFLLRVVDVERQPFRSMGFVSVILVSGVFLVGLPFVLL